METIKRNSRGEAVKTLQRALHLYPDGIFGPLTEEAVIKYQKNYLLTPDGIVGPKTWAVLNSTVNGEKVIDALIKSKRRINAIVVHCTASKEGKPLTVAQIRASHKKERGWSDIGYHYVVYLDGTVHNGRDVNISGAHVANHNSNTIGVVYVGGLDCQGKAKDTRTEAQKKAIIDLLQKLRKLYPTAAIKGHRDYSPAKNHNGKIEPFEFIKACPCFDAKAEYANI